MTDYDSFTGLYPISKTLRFELRPIGKTMEKIHESDFLKQDVDKAKEYVVMKKLIDDYHRKFINDHLSNAELNWIPLFNALDNARMKKDDISKKELENEQMRMRKSIIALFEKDENFKFLFNEKLFSNILDKEIHVRGDSEEITAFETFDKFSGYFIGFHENRKNMYSNEDKHNSIAYRLVSENFPKYFDNCKKYEMIKEKMPEVILDLKKEIGTKLEIDVDSYFMASNFNKVLTQKGIEEYNTLLGGISEESSVKIRGLNEFLNLHLQSASNKDKIKMSLLYKQILSEYQSRSFIPKMFENDDEVILSINEYYDSIKFDIMQRAVYLLGNYKEYDTSKIYIDKNYLTNLSQSLFGSWDVLGGLLQIYKANQIGDPNLEKTRKKVDKWLSQKQFTLNEILDAIKEDRDDDVFKSYSEKMSEVLKKIEDCDKTCIAEGSKLSGDDSKMKDIKILLDNFMDLQHYLRPFLVSDELDKDDGFYSEFNEVYDTLSQIIPLYNKVRNYATKKKLSSVKIKMNFGNPTLAAGWDLNKEKDNTAVIFVRDKNYYLGVMNPKHKVTFSKIAVESADDCYQKMVYKLLPGPNKMLPKVFFSKKGIEEFKPSEDLLRDYNAGKHKLGNDFDLDFCHRLIDFFKENIPKYESWSGFDFNFSPTESYADISQFYKEVADQGYKISFENIPSEKIDELVDNGELFLFQIYNKDFSEYSKGKKKNLHTMYWNAAFDPKNLRNVVVKINGEAELFYRNKSDIKEITHKKGSILVNRTDKDGKTMPDSVYYNICRYKNGIDKELSEEAKEYLDNTNAHEARYDIVKDRRYTVDKMFFHIPLTLNFRAKGDKNINKMVIDHVMSNPDVRIIGIDRGERNLLYISMIDRNGNICHQESLNVVTQTSANVHHEVDYHQKLDVREKERAEARKSWDSVEKIKDLKEGYLSAVVSEIAKMVVKNNAIVILEDLNFGFKRGRFKVEKQVYQKFEKMLIDKLNYLVFKDNGLESPGGVLNAYQLTDQFDSFQKLGKQSGILFYVPASYTSKIDPTTGFVDIFNTSSITRHDQRLDFINRMTSIKYDAANKVFNFEFDYRNFNTSNTDHKNVWCLTTLGKRLKYSRDKGNYKVDPTADIMSILDKYRVSYTDGHELKAEICSAADKVADVVYYAFQDSLKMRNSDRDVDYILSPIKNSKGIQFMSGEVDGMPIDADANGAYHIALKGELMLRKLKYDPADKYVKLPALSNAEWLKFVQTRWEE